MSCIKLLFWNFRLAEWFISTVERLVQSIRPSDTHKEWVQYARKHHTFLSTQEGISHFPSVGSCTAKPKRFFQVNHSERSHKYATLYLEILCLGVSIQGWMHAGVIHPNNWISTYSVLSYLKWLAYTSVGDLGPNSQEKILKMPLSWKWEKWAVEWMQGKMHGFETHLKKKVEPFNFSFHSKYILIIY